MYRRFLISLLALTCLVLSAAASASAGIVYENGPIDGQTDAWTINFGFFVSDAFTISTGSTTLTGLSFGAWLFPGDVLESVEVILTSDEAGGITYFDQMVNLTQSNCSLNGFNYNVCLETGSFSGPTLPNSTYWLQLQNAVVSNGDPVYWDENRGEGCHSQGCPSEASETALGTIPAEAFTLYGSGNGTTPEPTSLVLFASGVVGVAGALRRKLL